MRFYVSDSHLPRITVDSVGVIVYAGILLGFQLNRVPVAMVREKNDNRVSSTQSEVNTTSPVVENKWMISFESWN